MNSTAVSELASKPFCVHGGVEQNMMCLSSMNTCFAYPPKYNIWQTGILRIQEDEKAPVPAVNGTPPQGPPKIQDHSITISSSLRQIYVSTWSLICFVGMGCVALIFIVQRFNDEFRGGVSVRLASRVSPANSYSTNHAAGKNNAMVLTFIYTALAWTMSNGLLLNPRRKGMNWHTVGTGGNACVH